MREQTFSGLTDAYAPRKRGWKYAVGAAVIILAGFAYMRWAPDYWTRISVTRAPQVSAPATALPPLKASPAEAPVEAQIHSRTKFSETVAPKSIAPRNPLHPNRSTGKRRRPRQQTEVESRVRECGSSPSTDASQPESNRPPSGRPLPEASRSTAADQGSGASDLRAGATLSGGKHGRAGLLPKQRNCYGERSANRTQRQRSCCPISTCAEMVSPELRSGPASAGGCGQAGFSAGGPTIAQSGITGLPVREIKTIPRNKRPSSREGLLVLSSCFRFNGEDDCGVGPVDGD